jgi:hypothetical protein
MTYQPDLFDVCDNRHNANVAQRRHKSPAQASRILAHLRTGMALTPLQALDLFQCMRLAARIHELRQDGHIINETTITTSNGKRVAQYHLA